MPLERRTMLLGGGAALIVAVTAWSLYGPAEATAPPAAAPRPRQTRPAKATEPVTPDTIVAVRLDELTADRDQPGDAKRNPFRFQPKFVAPPPKPVEPPRPVNMTPAAPEPPRGPAPPPAIPLKFIGILEREDGTKWAVLTDGQRPWHGKEGSIIEGRYQILKIGVESIEMAYTDGRGKTTIRLTGQ